MGTIYRPRTINDPTEGASSEVFPIADTTVFLEYEDSDMDGALGAIASYLSDTPGSQATIDLTLVGDIYASYCDFTDLLVVGGTIYADETCTGEDQNNTGIDFGDESSRYHGVTENTYKRIIIDSGAVYANYGELNEALIGATRGGCEYTLETEIREIPVDGAKGALEGFDRIEKTIATLKIKLLEMSKENFLRAITGATASDYGTPTKTHDLIIRALSLGVNNYMTNVAIVGQVTGNNSQYFIGVVKNPIVNSPAGLSFADNDETVMEITFRSSFDPAELNAEPWEIRWPTIA